MENYKKCSACKEVKPWSAFSIRKATGKPRSECRICNCARSRKWSLENPIKQRAWQKEWDRRNPHKKEWAVRPEKAKTRHKKYYEENKDAIARMNLNYYRTVDGWLTKTLSALRGNSRDRGHGAPCFRDRHELRAWALSQPNFNVLWASYEKSGWLRDLKPSIDRLDNKRGYELDNIRLVTWRENYRAWLDSPAHRERQRRRFKNMWEQIRAKGTADKIAGAGEL